MSKKISISCHALQCKYGDVEAIEIAAAAGFDGVDFNVEGYAFQPYPTKLDLPEDELEEYFGAVRKKADECGIKIYQTHNLCGKCYNGDPENDKKVLYWAERGLRINQILGCPLTVVHPIGISHYGGKDASYELVRKENQRMFADIIPYAEKYGITIAMESFGVGAHKTGEQYPDMFADPEKMMREYEDMKTENKAFCFDSGHTNCATQFGFMKPEEFVRYFGERIKMLHLHDNDGIHDQHLVPRQGGTIDWPAVFEALEEIGYDGYYNYEIGLRYGDSLKDAVNFLGKYLREFTEKQGRV